MIFLWTLAATFVSQLHCLYLNLILIILDSWLNSISFFSDSSSQLIHMCIYTIFHIKMLFCYNVNLDKTKYMVSQTLLLSTSVKRNWDQYCSSFAIANHITISHWLTVHPSTVNRDGETVTENIVSTIVTLSEQNTLVPVAAFRGFPLRWQSYSECNHLNHSWSTVHIVLTAVTGVLNTAHWC